MSCKKGFIGGEVHMSRYCLEYANSELFLLSDFFKQFPLLSLSIIGSLAIF